MSAGIMAEGRQAILAALDRAGCERKYANYSARAAKRPALYYDLPACRRPFEYQRSYCRAD